MEARWRVAAASIWLAVLGAATGCGTSGPPSPVYEVQQSALVPAPAHPPPPSFDEIGDLYLGDATLIHLSQPDLEPNANAGLYVPRTQLQGAAALRVTPGFAVRLLYEHHPSGGEIPAAPTEQGSPGGFSFAVGLGVAGRVEVDDGLEVRFGLDGLMMQIQRRRTVRCVEHCSGVGRGGGRTGESRRGRDGVGGYGAWFTVHYVAGSLIQPWVGVVLRNQPTILGSFESTDPSGSDVEAGATALVPEIGAEILLTRGLRLIPHLRWPFGASPVAYGPIIGIGLRGAIGEPPQHWEGAGRARRAERKGGQAE